MNNFTITLVYPTILSRIIISCTALLIFSILHLFAKARDINTYIMFLGIIFMIVFILLSLPFFLKRQEIALIKDENLFIKIDDKETKFNLKELKFLITIDSGYFESNTLLTQDPKSLSTWGNYIIINSQNSSDELHIQFIPEENLLKLLHELDVEIHKNRSILMNNATDFFIQVGTFHL